MKTNFYFYFDFQWIEISRSQLSRSWLIETWSTKNQFQVSLEKIVIVIRFISLLHYYRNIDTRYLVMKISRYANMQGCILKGANLSECNLERADLSGAILDSAILMEVKMICANLERASLKNCRFDDSNGKGAIMEGN